jgi:hypothetical protein
VAIVYDAVKEMIGVHLTLVTSSTRILWRTHRGWPIHYPIIHPLGMVGYLPSQQHMTLLSLGIPYVPYASVHLPIILCHNKWSRGGHGNTCIAEALTSWQAYYGLVKLVVATRLHKQLSSFRLCISSNMPSYSEESHEWNTLANPKGMHFLFCKPGLRNACTNGHNSRQDCNLEELINQIKGPLNKLHPMSMASIARTQKSRETSPTKSLVSFSARIGDT